MPIVLKSGSLNLLEPSGPVQACHGNALPFTSQHTFIVLYYKLNTKILEELVATIFIAIPEDGGSKFFCNMMFNDVTTGWMAGESGLIRLEG